MNDHTKKLSAVIIINNYNYARFLTQSVESALKQTHQAKRVIIIDDGSTDGSVELSEKLANKYKNLELIKKNNGGQLSCFNEAAKVIGDTEWVFFLDADDCYPPNYLESVLKGASSEVSVILSAAREFKGSPPELEAQHKEKNLPNIIDVPKSVHITRSLGKSIGRPTSGIAVRAPLYKRLFPYYPEQDWRISADQVILRGSSILGAHKRFLTSVFFNYRIHGENYWHGRDRKKVAPERSAAIKRLNIEMSKRSIDAPKNVEIISIGALKEILSIPKAYRPILNIPSVGYFLLATLFWPVRKRKF